MPNQAISVKHIKQERKRVKIKSSEISVAVCLLRANCLHEYVLSITAIVGGSANGERWKMSNCYIV
jgi:hypothetical protein